MEIRKFIENFIEALEIENESEITETTVYKELDEWDSLAALSTISMVDDEYGVTISNKDLRSVDTIQQLYELIKDKK